MIVVRRNLTDRKVKSLKRERSLEDKLGHYDTWDTDIRGFGIRTSKTGRRTFVLMARYPGSANPVRRALGSYPELTLEQAREKARAWLELIRKGKDPAIVEEEEQQAHLRLQANTFAAVAEKYLETKVVGKQRKATEVVRDFRGVFIAIWGERPITSIAKGDVVRLIEGVRDNGTAATLAAYGRGGKAEKKPAPGQARNLLGYLKTFFAWAAARDEFGLESSPCTFIKGADIIGERQSDDRVLSDPELQAFWRAATDLPYPYGPIYRLLLLSGLRLNEVADARWDEFDLPKGIWTIPAARMKGKNGKARPHSVPLTADILAILNELPRFNGGDYLFSTTGGKSPVWVSDKVKKRLDALMILALKDITRAEGGNPDKVELPSWINHDLRRTLRSRLSELRVDGDVAEAILAHVKPGIRGVYDRYEHFDEKRHALELWATRLRSITQPPSNVVELAGARR
jgi:integrase